MTRYSSTTTMSFNTRADARWRRNQNTVAFSPSAMLGPVAHTVLISLMIATLGLIYLTQVTKTSTYGYQLDGLKEQRSTLAAERQDLENENAKLEALDRLKTSSVAQAMTEPASVQYATN